MPFKKIVCATDLSPASRPAITWARYLADHLEAELDLLFVLVPKHSYEELAEIDLDQLPKDGLIEGVKAIDREKLAALGGEGANCTVRAAQFSSPAIVDYLEEVGADLVVLGTHGRRGLRRLLIGSVAQEVLHRAGCSVLVVPSEPGTSVPTGVGKIVTGIDFSDLSEQLVEVSARLAGVFRADVELLHVLDQPAFPPYYPASVAASFSSVLPELQESLQKRLDALLPADPDPDGATAWTARAVLDHGAAGIVNRAKQDGAGLVVVGHRGIGGLGARLLGSTAESVSRLSRTCPVLTLRTREG